MRIFPDYAFVLPLAAFTVCWLLLLVLLRRPDLVVDVPNERSLHERPVPRTGGVAIVTGALGTSALFLPSEGLLLSAALAMALVSLVDDWRPVPAFVRLCAHLLITTVFVSLGLGGPAIGEAVFLVLAIVWLSNLYNFMDGSDGLAGGMALIGFSAYALGAHAGGHPVLAWLSAAIAAAAVPFLFHNFHPARIFMGDVGSVTLGFLAGAIGALGWREGVWPPLFPLFVFSPFIADASLTLVRRALAGEKVWRPHREHYYQKLVRLGLGHRNTALAYYAAMALAAIAALATLKAPVALQLGTALAWTAALLVLAFLIESRWKRSRA